MPKKSITRAIFYFFMVLIQNTGTSMVLGLSLVRDHPTWKSIIYPTQVFIILLFVFRIFKDIKRLSETNHQAIEKRINEMLREEFWAANYASEPITAHIKLERNPKQMYPLFFFRPKDLIIQSENETVRISGVLYNTQKIYKLLMSSQGYKS